MSFSSPLLKKTPHSRLLYQKFKGKDSLRAFRSWAQALCQIDQFIDSHPRLERANPYSYLYFFGDEEGGEYWGGREIVGHFSPSLQEGEKSFFIFDAFRGSVLSWQMGGTQDLLGDDFDLFAVARNLKNSLKNSSKDFSKKSFSKTWRVEIGENSPLQISFQFFESEGK